MKYALHISAMLALALGVLHGADKPEYTRAKVTYGDGSSRVVVEKIGKTEDDAQSHVYDPTFRGNPSWGEVKADEYGFFLVSLLDEKTELFVFSDGAYKPVYPSSFKLGQFYGVPSSKIKLLTKTSYNGQDYYSEALELDFPKDCKDAIFLIKKVGGKLSYAVYDISLNNFPLNSFGLLNFSSARIGVLLGDDKKVFDKMEFGVMKLPDISPPEGYVVAVNKVLMQAFDLTPKSPHHPKKSTIIFPQNRRYLLIFFEFSDSQTRTPIRIIDRGPRKKS